jgi:hypothetical protein
MFADGRRRALLDVTEPGAVAESVTLRTNGGSFTDDSIAALTTSYLLVSEEDADRILRDASRITNVAPLTEHSSTPFEEIRRALLLQVDPMPGLQLLNEYLGEHADVCDPRHEDVLCPCGSRRRRCRERLSRWR